MVCFRLGLLAYILFYCLEIMFVYLSPKTIAAIALAFVDGVQNAPNPVVSVQDITDVQQGRTLVIDSATN